MERQNGPWRIKQRRHIYHNPHLSLFEDEVIQPDGKPGRFAIVEVPAGVSVLPVDSEGHVYLTRQFRYMYGQESIEVISGAVDEGERALEAARRETLEEAGILAEEWRALGEVRFDTSTMAAPVHLFLARGLTMSEPQPDSTERIEIFKMSLDEALALAMDGTIVHGASVALLFKTRWLLDRADQDSAR